MMKKKKIGLLGGTFDPIHLGHLVLAEEVMEELKLDKVIFVPAYKPPHKTAGTAATAPDRLRMVELAIAGNSRFSISRLEIDSKRKCFTIETLRKFKKMHKKDDIFFITGSDSLFALPTWRQIEDIFKISKFVVGRRPGYPLEGVPHKVLIVKISPIDVSSSQIRKRIKQGKSVRYLVPEAVIRHINRKGLYKNKRK
jgi:nicotinate-nucleotide adenylyltransferase